jgi:anthranilate phosphoribosyltransferase
MKAAIEKLLRREDLSQDEATTLMGSVMSGELSQVQIAAILTGLRAKGETVEEIAGFVSAMRDHAVTIRPQRNTLVDTCGTGGDGSHTFNISTATALVAAGAGAAVAKHGNRAVSSRCGSADVLEALGVSIDVAPGSVAELIDTVGFGFMFAPHHHPAMKHVAPVRRELGIRTVFNLLGPMTNPAGVKRQLVGVFDSSLTEVVAEVLRSLGSERVYVVHGADGSDEVSIGGETTVSFLDEAGGIRTFQFNPESVGIERADTAELAGGDAAHNAGIVETILGGAPGPRRDAVVLNAAFVIDAAGIASTIEEGVAVARESIDSGAALRVLNELRRTSALLARKAAN